MFQKVKELAVSLAVYGVGDVLTSLVAFLLLPWFTTVLPPSAYGVLFQFTMVELVAKIVFRWGVDASFMRFYYDCADDEARHQLAGTLFLFLLAVNGVVLGLALLASPLVSRTLLDDPGYTLALQLVLVNTFVGGFYFLPFHVLRIERRAVAFSLLNLARTAGTLGLRILFVLGLGMGVLGVVLADTVATAAFAPALAVWFARRIRLRVSWDLLRQALRFGLPRVPHGLAQQVIGPGTDAFLLRLLLPLPIDVRMSQVGLYGNNASLGLALKHFLAAFEIAWAPFYFQTMNDADARRTFAAITTYGSAVLALLAAGMAGVSSDLSRMMLRPAETYETAAGVIPWVALAVSFQGWYLLTSIGLNITKRTEYYPIATSLAAVVNLAANALLIPRIGIYGPAVAGALAYAVLATSAFLFSHRLYPIRYEWGRLGRLVAAAALAFLAARFVVPRLDLPLAGVVARGAVVVTVFPSVLALSGFFRRGEIARARSLVSGLTLRKRDA